MTKLFNKVSKYLLLLLRNIMKAIRMTYLDFPTNDWPTKSTLKLANNFASGSAIACKF